MKIAIWVIGHQLEIIFSCIESNQNCLKWLSLSVPCSVYGQKIQRFLYWIAVTFKYMLSYLAYHTIFATNSMNSAEDISTIWGREPVWPHALIRSQSCYPGVKTRIIETQVSKIISRDQFRRDQRSFLSVMFDCISPSTSKHCLLKFN